MSVESRISPLFSEVPHERHFMFKPAWPPNRRNRLLSFKFSALLWVWGPFPVFVLLSNCLGKGRCNSCKTWAKRSQKTHGGTWRNRLQPAWYSSRVFTGGILRRKYVSNWSWIWQIPQSKWWTSFLPFVGESHLKEESPLHALFVEFPLFSFSDSRSE